ncbi:hypothetical protein C0995_004668 [Termitomyces sp. Mi166|nr:hypothetical protein C0995_004668 [Termitomyces sp. Mi166\
MSFESAVLVLLHVTSAFTLPGSATKFIKDPTCLQQVTADQAFPKAAGDVRSQVDALIYRPWNVILERSALPQTSALASLPRILRSKLLNNIRSVHIYHTFFGLTSHLANFAPGDVNDPTARGNSCESIFIKNLLVEITTENIDAVVYSLVSVNFFCTVVYLHDLKPRHVVGGRGFVVSGSGDFLSLAAALRRSGDIQHNLHQLRQCGCWWLIRSYCRRG